MITRVLIYVVVSGGQRWGFIYFTENNGVKCLRRVAAVAAAPSLIGGLGPVLGK